MSRRHYDDDDNFNIKAFLVILLAVFCAAAIGFGIWMLFFRGEKEEASSGKDDTIELIDSDESEDPQSETNLEDTPVGAETEITEILIAGNAAENENTTIGIDVSKFQGTIDWKAVADAGIDFAMVRVGYRTQNSGEITADANAKYNMQEAEANGIHVGAYFFSTAVSEEEAVEEAKWTADYISRYQITYPVAYNCEGFDRPENRNASLTVTERTDIAIAFLTKIYKQGYTPMFYASRNEMLGDNLWETSRLEKSFKIWVAQYPKQPYPQTEKAEYPAAHDMWQYTNNGTVAGVPRPVDVNVAYFGFDSSAEAQNSDTPDKVEADPEALMNFEEVDETVTSKDETNLRDIPGQGSDSTVLRTLKNGETAQRTGVSDSGWSRLIIDGQRYYAVSNYLTTDTSYKTPVGEPDDGLKTKFTAVSENVTPKIEVNLRRLPSVTNPDATVAATVTAGEVFVRTGINNDYGWSRVEYNGETLYCVSSYLNVVE